MFPTTTSGNEQKNIVPQGTKPPVHLLTEVKPRLPISPLPAGTTQNHLALFNDRAIPRNWLHGKKIKLSSWGVQAWQKGIQRIPISAPGNKNLHQAESAMKIKTVTSPAKLSSLGLFASILAMTGKCPAQNFAVSAGDTINYTINGQPDPSFTLQRGVTYVFQINNLFIHPFYIKSASGFGSAGAYNNGVANNGATSGNITFTVPGDAPNALLYQCGNHPSMLGSLNIVTPATPPSVRIVYINVGDFITVKSTGTNGWSASPEFKCNASAPAWTTVANFTNSFNAGTNTTTFPRLDPICGSPNVLVRIRNQSN